MQKVNFQTNNTLLLSITRVTGTGIEDSLPSLLDTMKVLGGPDETCILFVTGTHGNEEGSSGITLKHLLEPKFYERDCRTIGIQPQDSMPSPVPQTLDENADDEALLRNPLYKKMKFNALDIKHFHKKTFHYFCGNRASCYLSKDTKGKHLSRLWQHNEFLQS